MDFFEIIKKDIKGETVLIPRFKVQKSEDLMVRGGAFYAIWDEETGLWTQDEYHVVTVVDKAMDEVSKKTGLRYLSLKHYDTNFWTTFKRFMRDIGNNSIPLDAKMVFANQKTKKADYASFKLDYSLSKTSCKAWDELVSTLYSEEERAKIEWAIGAIISGDAKRLQKFLVFYGPPGSGKSTILNVMEDLFQGYSVTFDAKQLGSNGSGGFATGPFASNPLVAIQQDGDLSKIEDNTRINSIVSHDTIMINEKYVRSFPLRLNTFLVMGTNQPVRISDAKSGIIRRLIDVQPTGERIESDHYFNLLNRIQFEHGAIANKCLRRYEEMGFHYYDGYKPFEMMLQTDVFLNFIEYYFDVFKREDGISLKRAYALYKEFCEDTGVKFVQPQYKFREELKNYFKEFHPRIQVDGIEHRSFYKGFEFKPSSTNQFVKDNKYTIELLEVKPGVHGSVFDEDMADQYAQYANTNGLPGRKWENVKSKLSSLDTTRLHYVKVPKDHIVIDFDLKDETGEKSLERNIEEALKWPSTYTELSQSGQGLHLHYIYEGDVEELASHFAEDIEIKTLLGDSSLRRKLTKCNNHVVSVLNSNLPKKERKMLDVQQIKSEKSLRELIERNIRKEIHPGTKPSVDFIMKILQDAYDSGLNYDVQDMRPRILTFAATSTNHSDYCIKTVLSMPFVGKTPMEEIIVDDDESSIIFFDVEVYPNFFLICWKYNIEDEKCAVMINPSPSEVAELFGKKLVGFNCRRYDNHILWARYLGYSNEGLFDLSQRIIVKKDLNALFGEAYNISYTDIFDFSSKKQGLKKFEIELGIRHVQLDIPWDKPLTEEEKKLVIDYCCNDVIAEQKVFHARKQDFVARKILAELSGLSVNHTTQNHTAKIVFGDDKRPQDKFVYTDLSQEFPGYKFEGKESTYRGEVTGEGGYVYAEPGLYEGVAVLDVASMHPTSIECLNLFGPYTSRFSDLKEARVAIKHKKYDKARQLLDGRLRPFLDDVENDEESAAALSYALKIVINIVYGLTSASFDNAFRDRRNKDNIVAKRGALFMIDLKHAVQERGFIVAHIKTDSIKIPNATPEIIQFVIDFGKKYGYDFEHETTYDKFCLVNQAVYVARETIPATLEGPNDDAWKIKWTAVGAQFQHPYVFKKLFTKEEITFDDLCETKSVVQGAMYLDMDNSEDVSDMIFLGTVGRFVPVETGGGNLWRIKDDKRYAVTGTKGFRWIRSNSAYELDQLNQLAPDMEYFKRLRMEAIEAIDEVGGYENLMN